MHSLSINLKTFCHEFAIFTRCILFFKHKTPMLYDPNGSFLKKIRFLQIFQIPNKIQLVFLPLHPKHRTDTTLLLHPEETHWEYNNYFTRVFSLSQYLIGQRALIIIPSPSRFQREPRLTNFPPIDACDPIKDVSLHLIMLRVL